MKNNQNPHSSGENPFRGLLTLADVQKDQDQVEKEVSPLGFMAKIKFRRNIAQVSDEKLADAYIDSGATHRFFFSRLMLTTYTAIAEEPVKGATGLTKIVGKGMVQLPINNGMIVEAYHAPGFSSNIL